MGYDPIVPGKPAESQVFLRKSAGTAEENNSALLRLEPAGDRGASVEPPKCGLLGRQVTVAEQMDRTRINLRRIRSFVLNAVLLIVVFFAVAAYQSRNMLATDGQKAPGLRGATLAGELYKLEDADGRPALIYFFAPWCRICAASADNLTRLRRWRGEDDIEIVAVALDWASPDEVRDYAERHELNVTVVLGDSQVAREWQVQAFPSYYVLDRNQRIARRDIGYSTQFGLWWRAWWIN